MSDDFKSINEPDSSKPATDVPGSINEPSAVPPGPPPAPPKEKPEPKKDEPPHKAADPDELEDELEQEIEDGDITRVTVTRVSKTAPKPVPRKK